MTPDVLMAKESGIVELLLSLPIFEAAWVLYLLLGMSLLSVAIILERWVFLHRRAVDHEVLRDDLLRCLDAGNTASAAALFAESDSLEATISRFGLAEHHRGANAVEELLQGAIGKQRLRYETGLGILATIGSNAPFIGLFGTVLGIIKAFRDLSGDIAGGAASVMGGISEALVATAIGLLVAIPAVVAYNSFRNTIKGRVAGAKMLSHILLASLKGERRP